MKTTIFAVICAAVGFNAAVAADHTDGNAIPSPTTLVESTLLPQFKAKVKMEAKGWRVESRRNSLVQAFKVKAQPRYEFDKVPNLVCSK